MEYKQSLKTKMVASWLEFCFKNGLLQESFLEKISFSDLIYLSNHRMDKTDYQELMCQIVNLQEQRIRKRIKMGKKIKIAFLCDLSSVWGFDNVIAHLEKQKNIECYAIVPLIASQNENDNIFNKKYKTDAITFLKKKKIKYYIVKEKEDAKWGDKLPDILFLQRPYEDLYFQQNFNMQNMKCSCMQMYIPYTFWVDKMSDIIMATEYMKVISKVFSPSKAHMDYYQKVVGMDERRLVFSGYPKVDRYYKKTKNSLSSIWKEGKVRIIYAPGFVEESKFSTFDLNCKIILDIAKESKGNVSWVIRLHPLMAEACIRQRVFEDMDEWESYISEWSSLENAVVSMNGSYEDIFKTSDAMIMDSVSFLPSYQYTGKPLLFLTRKTQEFNKLGRMLKEVVYTSPGKDKEQIEAFIQDVVIEKKDEKKQLREQFFKENLDYYNENHMLAGECIAKTVLDYFK